MQVLGIDIGGSAVKGAPVDLRRGKLLEDRLRIATPRVVKPEKMAEIVTEIVAHFRWHGPVGVGFPGVVHESARVLTTANLHPKFAERDVAKLFTAASGCPVHLINDADAAGLAEVRYGAGRKQSGTVLLLTLGTGIGSALFYDGQLYPNTEFGHIPLRGGPAEKYASAAVRERLELSWKRWGRRLSEYLELVEFLTWPELIILGGGVSAHFDEFAPHLKHRTPTVAARLGNEAGIVGAALWAAQQKARSEGRNG